MMYFLIECLRITILINLKLMLYMVVPFFSFHFFPSLMNNMDSIDMKLVEKIVSSFFTTKALQILNVFTKDR